MSTKPKSQPDSEFPHATGNPAKNALHAIGITTLEQVSQMTEKELLAIHGVGPKAVAALREAMAARGLEFKKG